MPPSPCLIAPQFLLFLLVGVGLYAFYASNGFDFGELPPWDPMSGDAGPRADFVFPIFIVTQLPSPLRGLLFAGVLAAALSSLTSALTAISSVALLDLLQPLRGAHGEGGGSIASGRIATLFGGVALMAVAWWAKEATLIFNVVFQFAGIFSGAKLGAVLLAMRRPSGKPGPVIAGMTTSLLVMVAIVFSTRSGAMHINWPWYSLIGTVVCLAVERIARRS